MEVKDLPKCPVEVTLGLIGEKWKVLIIRDLLNGTKRFGELKNPAAGFHKRFLLIICALWKMTDLFKERSMLKFRQK